MWTAPTSFLSKCAKQKEQTSRREKWVACGRGVGGCLLKAWLSVYYKLKILPCRVCSSRWRNGGHACVSVAPYPTAGGWMSGRRTVQHCWGVTGGQTGMWFSVYCTCSMFGKGYTWTPAFRSSRSCLKARSLTERVALAEPRPECLMDSFHLDPIWLRTVNNS